MTKISFVIPCYGSEKTIASVVEEIRATVAERAGYDYEVILVNDSSPDKVFSVITDLAAQDKKVKGIDLAKNFGQHSALLTGYQFVTGDIIVCLDDDGQTPASYAFRLIDKLNEGFDVVFAKYENKRHSLGRNLGSKANDLMACALLGKPKDLSIMSYFCCKRFIVDEMLRYQNPYPYIAGLLLRSTNKIANVIIPHREREIGASGYTLGKLLKLWINGFTSFSVKPLRVATFCGLFFSLVGFAFAVYAVLNKFIFNPDAPIGYSSLMAVLSFLGGMILTMMGLIGEYIGRIYISINRSPLSVVRQTVNIDSEE